MTNKNKLIDETLPKEIYLQLSDEPITYAEASKGDISWCVDKVFEHDVKYVLSTESTLDAVNASDSVDAKNATGDLIRRSDVIAANEVNIGSPFYLKRLNASINSIPAVNASQSEAIYQYCHKDKLWHDCTYDFYAKHIDYPECEARIVYLAP